ncbi:MAG TPA: anti-sigma regulatory factor [Deltaproteobacteria bacterium]|nr:anti-sigma regulatory factor [Deltaproteobacteria bacterium]
MQIEAEADVVVVRRRARELAIAQGFDAFAVAAITTAASELSRNVWCHGGGGHALLETVSDAGRVGLRLRFIDEGPGIADLELALRGGCSTGRSLGLGLSGSRRLVDAFHIETSPGEGTTIEVLKWARFPH